jgi:hypothetical protein
MMTSVCHMAMEAARERLKDFLEFLGRSFDTGRFV